MIRNRAIFIPVVLVFSSMCKKLVFLISVCLVLGLAGSAGAAPVPPPWANQDIGTVHGGVTGSADYNPTDQSLTVIGDGEDIWSPGGDDFHYVYRSWTGNCELITRITNITGGTNGWRKAGVMIREDLTDMSQHATMIVTPPDGTNVFAFQWVTSTSRDNTTQVGTVASYPKWVRLVRSGNTFTGYYASDSGGSPGAWTPAGTTTFTMSETVNIGFCLTSHQAGTLTTATFDNFGGDISFETITWPTEPNPANHEQNVPVETILTWTRGKHCDFDDVYFGTDPGALVHVGTVLSLPAEYDPGDPNIVASTTYYWQVVDTDGNGVPHPGGVWDFTTISGKTYGPNPAHRAVVSGAVDSGQIYQTLNFAPGPTTVRYVGYCSEFYDDVLNRVEDANLGPRPDPPAYSYYVGLAMFPPYTQSLERGKFYYWCVDAIDAKDNKFAGDVWQFGIQDIKASSPSPPDEAIFISTDVLLSWLPGFGSATSSLDHDVYFGTDFDAVNDANWIDVPQPPEYKGSFSEPNYQCSGLPYETKHYWRIDEVWDRKPWAPNTTGTYYKGDVWEFTTKILTSGYRQKGYLYLSPVPDAEYVSSQTRYFLVRFEAISPYDITNLPTFIDVAGEASGSHSGQTRIASDDRTVIFEVSSGFSNGELVTVTLIPTVDPGAPGVVEPYQYRFMVSGPMPPPPLPASTLLQAPGSGSAARDKVVNTQATPDTEYDALPAADMPMTAEDAVSAAALDGPMIMPNGVSVPSNFPLINITINDNPDPGYIFLDNRTSGSNSYNVIFDNTGSPIWYLQTSDERRDMKVQHNGVLTMLARSPNRFIGLDTHYREIASYRAVNGHSTDEHELVVLENGYYLLIGLRQEYVDMTQYLSGANPNARVGQTIIQEFTPEGDLIFQWRAWDNFDVRDVHLDNPYGGSFRFPHMNAIDIDEDGHILLSSRHISEVTKINRDTGEIIWRLSGIPKNNDFTYVNDPLIGFRNQHAIRSTGNGRYLLFDNGDLHSPQVSRGVEYELDLNAMTATVVWEFRETPDVYSHYMANTQRLPNGNTLINWAIGSLPKLTEVRSDGTKAFEMNWVDRYEAYRVWRCPWQGMADKPNLIIETPPDNITLLFNKFGDPNVDYYRIYGGTTPQPTTVIDTSTSTLKQLFEGLENGIRYYFRVTAVDVNGTESEFSNEESAVVSLTEPGQIVVINGDFCQGKESWIWEVGGSASASWQIEGGVSHFYITNGGTQISDIQLRQAGMKLVQGEKYVFEFDAWSAAQPRIIEAKVGQDESPWTNYSKIGYSYITPNPTHFRYPFTMQDPSDYNARVVFNAGTSNVDVYIDNVSLFTVLPGDFDYDGCVRFDDLAVLTGEWLKEQGGLIADLQGNGKVDFNDFAIFADSFMQPCTTTLVTEKDAKRVLVPTSNIGYNWIGNAEPYDDTGWDQIAASDCPFGIGYENSPGSSTSYTDLIGHDVGAQMFGIMNSCYIRIPFVLDINPNELSSITLKIRYDDGFVTYVNGEELARDKFDAPVPAWNDNADRTHDDDEALLLQPFRVNRVDKPDVFNALQLGDNILAIHGMNRNTTSTDFLISAELSVQ